MSIELNVSEKEMSQQVVPEKRFSAQRPQSPTQHQLLALLPIDWGVSYACARLHACLFYGGLAAIPHILLSYILFTHALQQNEVFLYFVFRSAVDAWIITAITFDTIAWYRGEKTPMALHALNALRYLPKILLSYALVFSVLLVSIPVPPFVLLVLFFVWAPFFCAGERFADQEVLEKDKEEDDEEGLSFFDFGFADRATQLRSMFSHKSLFEFGFARSMQLVGRNASVTLQLVVLVWTAAVVPNAIIVLFSGVHTGFEPVALSMIISSLSDTFVLMLVAASFCMLIPVAAQREIEIDKKIESLLIDSPYPSRVNLQSRPLALAIVVGIATAASVIWVDAIQRGQEMPEEIKPISVQAEIVGEQLMVTLSLKDPNYRFRWFEPTAFSVNYGEESAKKQDSKSSPPTDESADSTEEEKGVTSPLRFKAFQEDGSEIEEEPFTPFYGTLKMVLYFKIPERAEKNNSVAFSYGRKDPRILFEGPFRP